jgi:hypothetical protein
MQKRLAAREADHGGAAFLRSLEALIGSQLLPEYLSRVLDLAAAGACQIAAEQGFQHQDERIAFPACCLLSDDV